jgi:hypothetical protein
LTEPGRYQGKRLSATEVTRLYAAGERDFRGAVLRGCNFRGVDLSGVDFSGTKIEGTIFADSILANSSLSYSKTGLSIIGILIQIISVIAVSIVFGALSAYSSYHFFNNFWLSPYTKEGIISDPYIFYFIFPVILNFSFIIFIALAGVRKINFALVLFLASFYFFVSTTRSGFLGINYTYSIHNSVIFLFVSFAWILCLLTFYLILLISSRAFKRHYHRILSNFVVILIILFSTDGKIIFLKLR